MRNGHYSCKFLIGEEGCSVKREQNPPTAANVTGATFMPKVGLDKLFSSVSRWQYMLSLDAAVTYHASFSLVKKAAVQKENRTRQWRQWHWRDLYAKSWP
jgi:hypothetical protein